VPAAGTNGSSVNPCPFGAEPPITFQKMTTIRIRISVTERPSNESSARVATLTSP
jgi:hypothetical protein